MAMNLNEEHGFTLLEALVSLMITGCVSLLLISGTLQVNRIWKNIVDNSQFHKETPAVVAGNRQIEWHLFLNQLEHNLKDTTNPRIGVGVLRVDEIDPSSNAVITVEYRQPMTTSRRNFFQFKKNGNILMLTGIESPRFEIDGGYVKLNFMFRNGERYTGRIWVDSWVKED